MLKGYFACPKAAFVLLGLIFLEAAAFLVFLTTNTSFWTESVGVSQKLGEDANFIYGFLVSFTPIITGFLSDNYVGRFGMARAHLILFVVGFTLMAVSTQVTSPGSVAAGALGMVTISVAVGINKGVIPTFNADQFRKGDDDAARNRMFSWYYMIVNIGGVVSIYTIASLKDHFECGGKKCYLYTFGACIICVALATVLFFVFSKWFVRAPKSPNVVVTALKCVFCAIKGRGTDGNVHDGKKPNGDDKTRSSDEEKGKDGADGAAPNRSIESKETKEELPTGTWIDKAYPTYDRKFIRQVLQVLRVSKMFFIGLPFWTCYQSMFGAWMHQFSFVNGQVGFFTFTALTYLTFNPIAVVVIIFVLNVAIYPLLSKCVKVTSLRKMAIGGFLAVVAFGCVIGVEYTIKSHALPEMSNNQSPVYLWKHPDSMKCHIYFERANTQSAAAPPNASDSTVLGFYMEPGTYTIKDTCGSAIKYTVVDSVGTGNDSTLLEIKEGVNILAFYPMSTTEYVVVHQTTEYKRTGSGSTAYHVLSCKTGKVHEQSMDGDEIESYEAGKPVVSKYNMIQTLDRKLVMGTDCQSNEGCFSADIDLRDTMGGKYALFDKNDCYGNNTENKGFEMFNVVSSFGISSLWMWPQNFIFSAVEALLAVGALEFAYNQTAPSMKSVIQAVWLLTAACGSLIGLAINQFALASLVVNYIYATMMLIATLLFCFACRSTTTCPRIRLWERKGIRPMNRPISRRRRTKTATPSLLSRIVTQKHPWFCLLNP